MAGLHPCVQRTIASYAAAKAFVLGYGEALNYELRGTGVSCTVVSPGVTATEFQEVAGQESTLFQRLMSMTSRRVAAIGVQAILRGRSIDRPYKVCLHPESLFARRLFRRSAS